MYSLNTHDSIEAIPQQAWNRLTDLDTPFLRHELLAAMERHECVGEGFGWLPRHLALSDAGGELVAVAPCYLKFNSYGEFVFDWSWAGAYQRLGLPYYPKLVVASPYTPATGPRILVAEGPRKNEQVAALIRGSLDVAKHLGVSSLHWLFTSDAETQALEYCIQRGLSRFEPGAQGEHKISRGFLPTPTWSAHWIADSRLREAIGHFLERERDGMRDYLSQMDERSPYKASV